MEVSLAAEKIFQIGPLPITNSMLLSWIVSALLIGFAFLATKKMSVVPGKIQNFFEAIIEALYGLVESVAGDRAKLFFPLLATFFLFIILSNWLGLLPGVGTIGFYEIANSKENFVPLFRASNSDLNTTLALAIISVVATQYYGLRKLGVWGYITHYFHSPLKGGFGIVALGLVIGIFVGFLEVVSEFVKIVSLSFRLFGNIYAGEAVLTTVSGLLAFIAPLPFMLLEVIVGFVQAAVFTMLTLVFLSIITEEHAKEHE